MAEIAVDSQQEKKGDSEKFDLDTYDKDKVLWIQSHYRGYRARREAHGFIMRHDSVHKSSRTWEKIMTAVEVKHSEHGTAKTNADHSCQVHHIHSSHARLNRSVQKILHLVEGASQESVGRTLTPKQWLEATDHRHRLGGRLGEYYVVWVKSDTTQNFFYWLDYGDGKGLDLESGLTYEYLSSTSVRYLNPQERKEFEIEINDGILSYKIKNGEPLDLPETREDGEKRIWIFVMDTDENLYVNEKNVGFFHHSSFLSGGVSRSAGFIWVTKGKLQKLRPHSGHYHPSTENLEALIESLKEKGVNMDEVEISKPAHWKGDWLW